MIYHLLKNPDSMKMLLAELDNANLPSPVPWDIAHRLAYLDACIKEALRITPAVGIPLERVVPAEGVKLDGKYLSPGTVVGVNAWVVQQDKEVYGADADCWRPGRWIEASEDKRREMERTLFAVSSHVVMRPTTIFWEMLITVQIISLEPDQESVLENTSHTWRCIRSSLNS